ncbi:MAG TPA: hypothetical protein VE010_15135 [Thermoanaerobaculia bacterium]|nr:hypothetical protein [Thermoanaerobaculia bacterium]
MLEADLFRLQRIAAGCASVFLLPFIGLGLWVALHAAGKAEWVGAVAGGSFVAFGAAAMATIYFALRRAQAALQLRARHRDAPWLWRADWAAGVAKEPLGALANLWVLGILWSLISATAAYIVFRDVSRGNYLGLFALIFPAIGAGVVGVATYRTLRLRKFGRSVCRFGKVPVQPGRTFSGETAMRLREIPPEGLALRLVCVRLDTQGGGRHTSVKETVLWEDARRIAASGIASSGDAVRVPFSFSIPGDAPVTQMTAFRTRTVWRLEVTAQLTGIDYAARFDVPVFQAT